MTRMTEREFAALTGQAAPRRKYNNTIVERDGMKFDSQRELDRWCDLVNMQRAGEILDLSRQVKYDLRVNGVLIGRYVADFVYTTVGGMVIVEDSKGVRTSVFQLKKKLMKALYGVDIREA